MSKIASSRFVTLAISVVIVCAILYSISGNPTSMQGAASGKLVTKMKSIEVAIFRDDNRKMTGYSQVGTQGIDGLFEALENYGANLDLVEREEEGISKLFIKVDGLKLSPIVTGCKSCEPIVYEY